MERSASRSWLTTGRTVLYALLLSSLVLAGGLTLQRNFQKHAGERSFRQYSSQFADMLQEQITLTPAVGAVHSMGISNLRLKSVVSGDLPEDYESLSFSLTNLCDRIGADLVYAMDANGRVVICTPYDGGKRLTGNNYAFRPYFQKALAGSTVVYAALGATTFQRGIYYAAPVYAVQNEAATENAVIGVVVIKMPFTAIDTLLQKSANIMALVSPHGIIFSSSIAAWQLQSIPDLVGVPTGGTTTSNPEYTSSNPEYTSEFFRSRTEAVPLSLKDRRVHWQGNHYATQTFPIMLDDPAGQWTLLVLQNTAAWFPFEQMLLTTLLLLALCLAAGITLHARHRRQLASAARIQTVSEAAQTYKSIFNVTSDALFVHHAETGIVLDANDSAKKLYGYADADIEHLTPDGDFPYPGAVAKPAIQAAMENRTQIITFQSQNRQQRLFWAQATFQSYTIHGAVRILASVHDITEERATHAALTASKEMLEQEVNNRTVQLLQVQKMAAIGKFAERITHDVTNAMTRIIGYADMIRQRPDERAVLENSLSEIDTAAREMCEFSTDMLAFSHPSPLKLSRINLTRVLDSFQKFLRSSAPKGIEVVLRIPQERLMTSISPNHIEQALMHLAINSFEAMQESGTLTIALRRGDEEDRPGNNTFPLPATQLALIEVTDTGPGIAPEHLSHVFDPFFSTRTDSKRRGMGLTTVYLIMSRHNGLVNIKPSTPGSGTTVQLWLPLIDHAPGP